MFRNNWYRPAGLRRLKNVRKVSSRLRARIKKRGSDSGRSITTDCIKWAQKCNKIKFGVVWCGVNALRNCSYSQVTAYIANTGVPRGRPPDDRWSRLTTPQPTDAGRATSRGGKARLFMRHRGLRSASPGNRRYNTPTDGRTDGS